MANYYTDIPELKFHLNNPMMKRICELKERNYRDKDEFDYAPLDFEDAVDSYDKVLEITGEITGEIIAPNAEGVDEEGPHCANGRVEYASGTKQNLDAMVKAGLNGMTMPRKFGGLNFPITPYTMCAEIVAAADAGDHQNVGILTDLGSGCLDAGEFFLIIVAGQVHPAQEVVARAGLCFQLLVGCFHLGINGCIFLFADKAGEVFGVQCDTHFIITSKRFAGPLPCEEISWYKCTVPSG